jgi:hypothetical protein
MAYGVRHDDTGACARGTASHDLIVEPLLVRCVVFRRTVDQSFRLEPVVKRHYGQLGQSYSGIKRVVKENSFTSRNLAKNSKCVPLVGTV